MYSISSQNRVGRSQTRTLQSGFTLIELMLVLAIAGILLAVGIPSFRETIRNNQMTSSANETVGAFQYARTQAITRGGDVFIESRSGTDSDWQSGLRIWLDSDASGGGYDSANDETLRVTERLSDGFVLTSSSNIYKFSAKGTVGSGAGFASTDDFTLCDGARSGALGRTIELLSSGLVEVSVKTDCS